MQDWQKLAPHGPDRPGARRDHAATYFNVSQLKCVEGNLLLIVGGFFDDDSWICDLDSVQWKRVSVACNWAVMHAFTHNIHSSEDCKNGSCAKSSSVIYCSLSCT